MRSAFYFLYFTIALVSAKCNPPPYTAGLTLETGVFMDFINDKMKPAYSCECDVGVRYFWHSSSTPDPYFADKFIRIKTGTYNDCKNLCICSEEGICYTPATPYVNIYFISYCKDKNCHVYTIMQPPSDYMYGNLLREEEKVIAMTQVAPSNNYLMPKNFSSTQEALTLNVFYKTMPVKMQRLGLVCYKESFTGKEAVDHLESILPLIFSTKNYNREDCIKLLQQYVNRGYFVNVQNKKNKTFQDDDTCLYNFQHEVIGKDLNEEKNRVGNYRKQLISSIYTKLIAFLDLYKYEELFYTETPPLIVE